MNVFKIQYRLITGRDPWKTVTLFAKTRDEAIERVRATGIYYVVACTPGPA